MTSATSLIEIATSQVGVKESPANSNKVKYWDYYKEHTGANYQGLAWCAAFVAYCMSECGAWSFTKDEGRFRSCPKLVTWAKNNSQWLDRTSSPAPGDLIIFSNKVEACHVGIVVSLSGSTINTIEGNTSQTSNDNGGAVMKRERSLGTKGSSWYVLGFVRTPWEEVDEVKDEDISKIAQAVWEHDIEGMWANERLKRCNDMDYDTSDPTGRGKNLTTHDHTKWIAAKESDMETTLNKLSETVDTLTDTINKMYEIVQSSTKQVYNSR